MKSAIRWISGHAQPDDLILCEGYGRRRYLAFSFPLRTGDKPREVAPGSKEERFRIRWRMPPSASEASWTSIFKSPRIEVSERRLQYQTAPLRYGLTLEEKEQLLALARGALLGHVRDGSYAILRGSHIPRRFRQKCDVDVALWHEGRLRGSQIVLGEELAEAVASATGRAAQDPRFKPISPEEVEAVRIEVVLMSELRIPLSVAELWRDEIYPEKGYQLAGRGKKGWYLPAIHNIRRFSSLRNLLFDLRKEKLGGLRSPFVSVACFEVEDFIEKEGDGVLALVGPTPAPNEDQDRVPGDALAAGAAQWLARIQEADGNYPPVTDSLERNRAGVDWTRLPFVAWSLAEYARKTGDSRLRKSAERASKYLRRHVFSPALPIRERALAFAYCGNLALALEKRDDALTYLRAALASFRSGSGAIEASNVGTFLAHESFRDHREAVDLRARIYGTLKDEFQRMKDMKTVESVQFAEFARLAAAHEPTVAVDVMRWLASFQSEDGSFRARRDSSFRYARGSGKIFEVLACDPERYGSTLRRAAAWLSTMRLDDDSLYYVPPHKREQLRGGLRHDELNTSAWIDAAGHLILGVARLLPHKYHE